MLTWALSRVFSQPLPPGRGIALRHTIKHRLSSLYRACREISKTEHSRFLGHYLATDLISKDAALGCNCGDWALYPPPPTQHWESIRRFHDVGPDVQWYRSRSGSRLAPLRACLCTSISTFIYLSFDLWTVAHASWFLNMSARRKKLLTTVLHWWMTLENAPLFHRYCRAVCMPI